MANPSSERLEANASQRLRWPWRLLTWWTRFVCALGCIACVSYAVGMSNVTPPPFDRGHWVLIGLGVWKCGDLLVLVYRWHERVDTAIKRKFQPETSR